jgi:hypothetical protein
VAVGVGDGSIDGRDLLSLSFSPDVDVVWCAGGEAILRAKSSDLASSFVLSTNQAGTYHHHHSPKAIYSSSS